MLKFSETYDKVSHQRLLGKVKSYGMDEVLLRWRENWLIGRKQIVVINGETSEW